MSSSSLTIRYVYAAWIMLDEVASNNIYFHNTREYYEYKRLLQKCWHKIAEENEVDLHYIVQLISGEIISHDTPLGKSSLHIFIRLMQYLHEEDIMPSEMVWGWVGKSKID